MRARLIALPILALVFAAIDTVLARADCAHRPADVALFAQATLLWLGFGLLALAPAALTERIWRRVRRGREAQPERERARERALGSALVLAAWMGLPVLAHARLNAFSDLGGDVSLLKTPRPWLEVAGVFAGAALVLWGAWRLLRRVPLRWTALSLVALAGAAGLCIDFHREDPAANRASAPPGSGERPNLLLLIWDTTRAASLDLYGYDRDTTPHLAALASDSLVFENARSASRYTLTSHLSMLTGVYPSDHGARITRQRISPSRTPSIAAALRDAGYRTGGFVGTGVLRAQTGVAHGFEVWDDLVDPPVCDTYGWALVHDLQALAAKLGPPFSNDGQPHWFQDFTRPAGDVLERAAAWIREDDPRPWFCMVNLYDVHWPYLPGRAAQERWVSPYTGTIDGHLRRSDRFRPGTVLDDSDNRHLRELYDAEMWQLDQAVDRFLSGLDLAHQNTGVVMVSDHGEAFGEAGRYEHNDILECQVRVPFLVRPPHSAPGSGRRSSEPVSGVDVAPTVLALAGCPVPAHFTGRNALAQAEPERRILVEDRDQIAVTDVRLALYRGNWKLVRRGLGNQQKLFLYDLGRDPLGVTDVGAAHPELVAELSQELERFREQWHADDLRDALDTGPVNADALKALGYTGN
jgi:arylsulfatase A-like enzyme